MLYAVTIEPLNATIAGPLAILFAGLTDELIVATYNERHLSRYLNARHWKDIEP